MSSTLHAVKLGAPKVINGKTSPNAELTVQVMENCEEMVLKDADNGTKCTKDGALKTAATLLKQRVNEDVSEQEWYTPADEEKSIKVDVVGNGNNTLTRDEINAMYELLGKYTSDSSITGTVTASGAYQDDVTALTARFPGLSITAAKWYMKFKDSEVVKVLVSTGVGDGSGICEEDIPNIKKLSNFTKLFIRNTSIKTFDEYGVFGELSIGAMDAPFCGCTNLERADLSKIKKVYANPVGDTKIRVVYFPILESGTWLFSTSANKAWFLPSIKGMHGARFLNGDKTTGGISDIGYKVTDYDNDTRTKDIILRGNCSAVDMSNMAMWFKKKAFVLPSLVETYKTTGWSVLSSLIHPIGGSEWVTTMQALAAEEGYTLKEGQSWSDPYIDYDIYGIPESDRPFVSFKDAEVEAVLAANGVGGDGLIDETALAGVTDIGTWFQGNENIKRFDELALTGVTELKSNAFRNSTLQKVNASKIEKFGEYSIGNYSGVQVNCVNSIKFLGLASANNIGNVSICATLIDFGKNIKYQYPCCFGWRNKYFVFRSNTVVEFNKTRYRFGTMGMTPLGNFYKPILNDPYNYNHYWEEDNKLFVLASLLSEYKSSWKGTNEYNENDSVDYEPYLFAIGGAEWQTLMQTLAEEEGYTLKSGESWADEYIDYKIYGVEPPTE